MAKEKRSLNVSKKTVKTVIKEHKRSDSSGAMIEKARNTGKFAAEVSPRVKPPKKK